jgi:hypothetical protein
MLREKRATSSLRSTGVVMAARIAENLCATGEVCTSDSCWQSTVNDEPARDVGG